ncbi:hypothetical protein [Amycolatopsis sp. lyj-23]|uniref:hypothetical protein n=1 Tax=Amycolatopsis sp. lyj-23 TaxID=2789283 RepID=UPI00397C2B3B
MANDLPRPTSSRDNWRQLLGIARDPLVERFAEDLTRQSRTSWNGIGLPANYAERQFRLHLPALSRDAIAGSSMRAARILATRLHSRFDRTAGVHRAIAASNRPSAAVRGPVHTGEPVFRRAPDEVGLWLHREVHYLHCERSDSIVHVGAFVGNADVPALCLSFSQCDRPYLLEALENAATPTPEPASIVVLTRAASTMPLPRNLVSRLVAWAARELRIRTGATLCVTAINPLLGFDGASFRAAGFVPFAMSPMTYQYDRQGLYVTRRMATVSYGQLLDTPPIVWLVRTLEPRAAPIVHRIVTVLPPAYRRSEGA